MEGGGTNGDAAKNLEESLTQDGKPYFCYSCGKDCTRVRYHNAKNPPPSATTPRPHKDLKFDLCSLCFQEGRFPSSTSAADYTKLENDKYRSIGDKESPWSDAELLLLLEGLEMFDDNWESVADHVGSRTREECVLQFLQLQIEDKYREETPAGKDGVSASDLAYLSGGRLPFSQFDNPVMSVMGFLAGLADPATTAKAAGKSVEEMRKSLRQRIEQEAPSEGGAENPKESSSSSDKDPQSSSGTRANIKAEAATTAAADTTDDTMDVDDTTSLATRDPPPASTSAPTSPPHDLPTTALSLTAARSAALASHTERQLTHQVAAAVNLQLQKLELKLQQFAEMEALLQAERREVERMRQRLFLDRLQFRGRVRETEALLAGLKIQPPVGETLTVERERPGGGGGGGGGDVEPFAEGSEGFMKHEI
jgi:SWI/SNF related-matrix-associated actin-dependent regulator of chromatin subfamily C